MTKPSSLKISPARREQLRATYLLAFDNFSTDRTEVANAVFDGNRTRAANALRTLAEVGLMDSTDVNDAAQGNARRGQFAELAWQATPTYDFITRDEAVAMFDSTFPTNTNTGANTMSNDKTNVTAATADETPAALKDLQAKLTPNAGKSAAKKSVAKPSAKKSAAKKPAAKKSAAKSKETNVTATATAEPKLAPTLERLFEYLRDSVQAEFDPERELRPYVNSNGKLFIHSSDWINWLTNHGTPFAKSEAAQPLRELGLVVRATPIPTKDYAKGFYQGTLPTKVKDLPRRESRRAAAGTPRASRNPFGRFEADALGLLHSAVNNYPKRQGGELRTQLLEQLDAAMEAQRTAAAAADTNGNA